MYENTINDSVTMGGEAARPLLVDRYRVMRQLGQGGMGSVWLAEDTHLDGKLFAVKMLPSILVSNKRAYRQLKDEALLSMKLTHSNIVTLRAFEENDGNPFLVMDYIDGQTLDDYLVEKGRLSEEETIRLLEPVASALDYAHSEGVIHRDIKPSNVMIRKDGRPFVMDFGIAREIQETMTRVTGRSSSGTLMYMSPEQLDGAKPSVAQDIYSFAVMAYECLSGELPFCRGAIEDQIRNKKPEPLSSNIGIASRIMAGLAKSPELRPSNCKAMFEQEEHKATLDREECKVEVSADGCEMPENRETQCAFWGGVAFAIFGIFAVSAFYWNQQKEDSRMREHARIVDEIKTAEKAAEMKKKAEAERARQADDVRLAVDRKEKEEKKAREVHILRWRNACHGDENIIELSGGEKIKMRFCAPGSFTMGSPSNEQGRFDDEILHNVKITKGFWFGETEVTQGQWKGVMGETVLDLAKKGLEDDTEYNIGGKKQTLRQFWNLARDDDPALRCGDLDDDIPVYNVSWHDAKMFCRRLTRMHQAKGLLPEGWEYRLPTEAEWEYACRADTTTSLPNGREINIVGANNAPALDASAWYGGNSSVDFLGRGVDTSGWQEKQYPGGRAFARKVRGKMPNEWGFYDMIGNVYEWCEDWYGSYPTSFVVDPTGSASGDCRVLRGGGWISSARDCRSADRVWDYPGLRNHGIGFRLACSAGPRE